jgi:hypothetical protein
MKEKFYLILKRLIDLFQKQLSDWIYTWIRILKSKTKNFLTILLNIYKMSDLKYGEK